MNKLEHFMKSYTLALDGQPVGITFDQIEKEIENIFKKIIETSSLSDTELHFNLLDKVQLILAKIAFKDGAILTPNLKKFVYDFDRIDDLEQKKYMYSTLKSGGNYFSSSDVS